MSMTQAQLAAATRDVMDAVSSVVWSDATVLTWLGLASWQEYANILNANNTFYSQSITTLTQDSNGQVAISGLTTGTTDSVKNFYRVLSLAQPTTAAGAAAFYYRQSNYKSFPNPQPNTSLPYVWYRLGTKIQVLPIVSGQALTFQVNFRPPRVDQLSASSITVDFPDGYETLLAFDAAALGLLKGANEADAAKQLKAQASEIRHAMLQDIGREGTWPIVMQSFDLAEDWAG